MSSKVLAFTLALIITLIWHVTGLSAGGWRSVFWVVVVLVAVWVLIPRKDEE